MVALGHSGSLQRVALFEMGISTSLDIDDLDASLEVCALEVAEVMSFELGASIGRGPLAGASANEVGHQDGA